MRREVAEKISSLMLDLASQLDGSINLVASDGDLVSTEHYKKVIGKIMGEMLIDILNPIFSEYPGLKPTQLK